MISFCRLAIGGLILGASALSNRASIYWDSAPPYVPSGTPYTMRAIEDWGGYIELYRGPGFVFQASSNYQVSQDYTDYAYGENGGEPLFLEYLAISSWAGSQAYVQVYPTYAPVSSVTVDGLNSGATVWRPHGGPATVTVRFKATDQDYNLTGIRPQIWHPATGTLNNNAGSFIAQSGNSGEVVWTVSLPHSGAWYFWTDAQDINGYVSSSSAWSGGFQIIVNESPNMSFEILDQNQNLLSPSANGRVRVRKDDNFYVRVTASDNDTGLSQLYLRMNLPNATAINWSNVDASGATASHVFGPFNGSGYLGVWDLWAHCRDAVYSGSVGAAGFEGNNYGWRTVEGPDVEIYQPNRAPTVSLSINSTTSAGGAVNSFNTNNGAVLNFSSSASDVDGNFSRIRVWANFNYQGWFPIRDTTAITDSFTYTLSGIGTWQFHSRSLDSENAESSTAVIEVSSLNRAPTVVLTSSLMSPQYGQSFQLTATASDADANLYALGILRQSGATYQRPVGIDYSRLDWNSHGTVTGWSNANFVDDNATGGTAAKSIWYKPTSVGAHVFHANAYDGTAWTLAGASVNMTVTKATPVGTYQNKALAEGVALSASHLNAVFSNPYDTGLVVPGTITYQITAGGVAPYTNGTFLYVNQLLPSGNYTVQAAIPASANYEGSTRTIAMNVSTNGQADNDQDGVNNATEIILGTNPNVAGQSPAALQLKINTPRS